MQLYSQYREEHLTKEPLEGEYATEPFDDYERLRNLLMECIPDFHLRLKLNPKTSRMVFSVDVESVFDIAWLTLARMMTDDPVEEHRDGNHENKSHPCIKFLGKTRNP